MEDKRLALARKFKKSADLLEVVLLAAMAPFFVFPKQKWTWLFLVFPLIWIVRWTGKKGGNGILRSRTVIDAAVLILCIQLLISTLSSGDILTSLPKITGILYGILVFYGLVRLLQTDILIRMGIGVFIIGSAVLATISLVGMSMLNEPLFAKAADFMLEKVPQKNWGFQGAELGLNQNALAGIMMLFVPLCIMLVSLGMKKKARNHLISQRIDLVLFSSLTLYYIPILFLTQSIGGWIGLSVSLWLVLTSWKAKASWFLLLMVFVIIVLVMIPAKNNTDSAKQTKSFWKEKIESRYESLNEGLEAVGEKPITGIGVNQLRIRPGFRYELSHAHNQLIHTAAELGIPGLMAYLAILMGTGYMCLEVWKKAPSGWMKATAQGLGAGQLAHFFFGLGDSIPLGAKPGIFFWVSLALIAAMYNFTIRQKEENSEMA